MGDIVVGLLAIAVGLAFCLRGFVLMRTIISIWGAFAGFVLGAGVVAALAGEGFLASVLGWVVGFLVALLFAVFAYLYYEVSVIIAMGAVGFAIGTAVTYALGVTWNWVIVLVGVAVGVLLALVAIVGQLPLLLLVVVSALGGASVVVAGVMLLVGTVDLADFTVALTTQRIDDDWWWYVAYLVLAFLGIMSQTRMLGDAVALRDAWERPA